MDIRDMMELGDFVYGVNAPHPTTLELMTEGLLISAHAQHPRTREQIAITHRLTRQQTHDWRLPEVRELVRDLWSRVNAKLNESKVVDVRGPPNGVTVGSLKREGPPLAQVPKPVCPDCRGTGYPQPDTIRSDREQDHHSVACDTCDGRGWVVEPRK